MEPTDVSKYVDDCSKEGPQSALERQLIEEYLDSRGYSLAEIRNMQKDEAKKLMEEACRYASLKLAEIESRAHFRSEIRAPHSSSSS
jgi:hypothetical protein